MNDKCPVYKASNILGKRWTILILLELHKGKDKWKRYTAIKSKLMDITPKILSERLKELKEEDLIKKRIDASMVPVKTEYSLTKSGEDIIQIITCMKKWALKWKVKNSECEKISCEECNL